MERPSRSGLPVHSCGVLVAAAELLQAYDYAEDCGRDVWQFALEWPELAARGLSRNDLRWLAARGFADQACEAHPSAAGLRVFEPKPADTPTDRTCVVLTRAGALHLRPYVEILRVAGTQPRASTGDGSVETRSTMGPTDTQADTGMDSKSAAESKRFDVQPSTRRDSRKPVRNETHEQRRPSPYDTQPAASSESRPVPKWDPNLRELWLGDRLVKRFRVPASNQELILTVFEEEGWPESIDDPLPPEPNIDPKHRLQATVKSLNSHQVVSAIRFHGNGGGRVIYWETIKPRRR
jgi:hypothetical protein